MKKLSILICTLNSRKRYLQRIMNILNAQLTNDVEILIEEDSGEKTIGEKRNLLLNRSTGLFSSYIDDDDRVDISYISKILTAMESVPDCIGVEGIITFDGKRPQKFIHSLRYKEWFEKGGIFYRNPNHLNPIKTEIALKVKFPELNNGEDHDYSKRILPLLSTEVYIDGPIYFYDFRTVKNA